MIRMPPIIPKVIQGIEDEGLARSLVFVGAELVDFVVVIVVLEDKHLSR